MEMLLPNLNYEICVILFYVLLPSLRSAPECLAECAAV